MSDIDHAPSAHREVSWAALGGRARAWRVVHASWSVAQLWCLGDAYESSYGPLRAQGKGMASPAGYGLVTAAGHRCYGVGSGALED